jgi:hypothetical protein
MKEGKFIEPVFSASIQCEVFDHAQQHNANHEKRRNTLVQVQYTTRGWRCRKEVLGQRPDYGASTKK